MDQAEALKNIGTRLNGSIKEHNSFVDGFWYTATTVLSLSLSTFSAFAANDSSLSFWVATASAITAFCIGLERALGFGARWRYHREMKSGYQTLQDGIDYIHALPEPRKELFLNDWWSRLVALRGREGQLPNTGGDSSR